MNNPCLPANGYRSDAVFYPQKEHRGITFVELPIETFDALTPAAIKFIFQDSHYKDVVPGQAFAIMEGPHQVGEGKVIAIEHEELMEKGTEL